MEWLEQLKLVANACHWDESTKLVNLVTRLKGKAFAFYRSCDTRNRNQYSTLVEVVASSLFHDRKQKSGENVDSYAQDLKCLFYKAYPLAQQASAEMQDMGRSVLTNQIVAGLVSELKGKLAGKEGNFEQLLTLARFEEAKARDLQESRRHEETPATSKNNSATQARIPARWSETSRAPDTLSSSRSARCYECGVRGHRARDCPDRRRRNKDEEAQGGNTGRATKKKPVSAAIAKELTAKRLEGLRHHLREVEVELALQRKSVTMSGVTCDKSDSETVQLGSTVYVELEFEGSHVKALVDIGSPATIVSLDSLLNALAKGRPSDQTLREQ